MFACAGKTEPPSRLIFSQTLAGKIIDYLLMTRPLELVRLEASATS